jgi:hypothetical protein
MRRCRQLISLYLTSCLAFGGTVGLSPDLHRLIEHGNRGPAHTHHVSGATALLAKSDEHKAAHTRPHSHPHAHPQAGPSYGQEPFTHDHAFGLPMVLVSRVLHAIGGLFLNDESVSSESSSSPENPEHHHDSLPQLLASGLIEQFLEAPSLVCALILVPFVSSASEGSVLTHDWDAQTASRAPPSIQS